MGGTGILIIVILYLVFLLGLGVWSSRLSSQGSSEYFLGGRNLGPWVLSMSEKASESSGFMTVGLPGEAYSTGMSAAWNAVSSVFSIFNWLFFAKRIRRLSELQNSITVPDFLSARFKDDTHVMRWVSIVVMTVFMTVYVTAQFVAFGVLFEVVLGVSFSTGVIVGGIVTIIYTMMGGFLAVSLTDFIQGLLMAFAFFVLPILGIIEIGGFTEMGYQLSDMMGEEFLAPFFGNSALTERQTRFEVLLKIDGKDAQSVTEAIESLVERAGDHMASLFKTITSDNGSEFSALHETLKHVTDVYFARPFASYERGTSENQHKLIRRFIPKGQSISSISDRQIQRIQRWMNDYPRKILGYQTPHERFAKSMQHTTGTKCLV